MCSLSLASPLEGLKGDGEETEYWEYWVFCSVLQLCGGLGMSWCSKWCLGRSLGVV